MNISACCKMAQTLFKREPSAKANIRYRWPRGDRGNTLSISANTLNEFSLQGLGRMPWNMPNLARSSQVAMAQDVGMIRTC